MDTFKLFLILIAILHQAAIITAGEIEGRVVDSRNWPLADVYVTLSPGKSIAVSDSAGIFSFTDLGPGTYTLYFKHISFEPLKIDHVRLETFEDRKVLGRVILKTHIHDTDVQIVTATRMAQKPSDLPVSVNVLPEAIILQRESKTSAEALREDSGIFVQKTNHGGGSAIIRGLSSNRILLLVDGIRLNNALYRLGNHQYLTTVDYNLLKSIEVVRGPASVQYGSDALGGTINLISKDADFTRPGFRGGALLRLASADRERSSRVAFSYTAANWSLHSGLSYKKFGDLKRGANSDYKRLELAGQALSQSPSAFTTRDFDLMYTRQLQPETSLRLAWQQSAQNSVPRYDKYAYDGYHKWLYDPQERNLVYARFNSELNNRLVNRINLTLSLQRQKEGRIIQKTARSITQRDLDEDWTTGLTLQTSSYTAGHELLFGLDIYRDDVNSSRSYDDPVTGKSWNDSLSRYPDDAVYLTGGLFLQDQWAVSEKLLLSGGIRFSVNTTNFERPDPVIPSVDQTWPALTGQLGLVYKFSPDFGLRSAISQGFRAPNLSDLSKFGQSKGNVYEVPDPQLEPEKLLNWESGLFVTGQRHSVNLTCYYSRLYDLLASAPATFHGRSTLELNGQSYQIKSKQNLGRGFITGIEGDFQFGLGRRFRLRGNVAYTYGQNLTLNEPLDGIPPLFGLLGLQYKMAVHNFDFFLRFAGSQTRLSSDDKDDPRIPVNGTPAWQTLNLRWAWSLGADWHVQMSVENLLDYNYREHGSGINGPGRNFIFSLRYHQQ